MRLNGKKIAVLLESDYYEHEIWYYHYRFPEEGAELHFLTRLWGQPKLTFTGHEYKAPFECSESFEGFKDRARGPGRGHGWPGPTPGCRPGWQVNLYGRSEKTAKADWARDRS